MSHYKEILDKYSWEDVKQSINASSAFDVERALNKEVRNIDDFKALISPAALPYLEKMASMSNFITQKRFGKVKQLYIPLYLSNICYNSCVYCGFSMKNEIHRIQLNDEEIIREAKAIKSMGFDHVLLVTGEANNSAGLEYLKNAIRILRPYFSNISLEVQPLEEHEYVALINEGLHAVYVYQETYNKINYPSYHPQGRKADFYYRLDTPDRLGKAGIKKIGLGILLGLEDWRTDSFFLALHLNYLERTYWQTRYSISFPRLRPFQGGFSPNIEMSDRELVQLICAYRLLKPEVELSLSTRENENFRNHAIHLGITAVSAASKTNPGGYVVNTQSLEQFEISDDRNAAEIVEMISSQGYEAIWKDWDRVMG